MDCTPHCNIHDTLCGKAGLEKDDCRKAEQHENKNGMGLYNIRNRGTGIPNTQIREPTPRS